MRSRRPVKQAIYFVIFVDISLTFWHSFKRMDRFLTLIFRCSPVDAGEFTLLKACVGKAGHAKLTASNVRSRVVEILIGVASQGLGMALYLLSFVLEEVCVHC